MKKLMDSDEDSDKDGLKNSEEKGLGTDILLPDRDRAGLTDFDEIKKYKSDPKKNSTMDDGLTNMVKVAKGFDLSKKYGKADLKSNKTDTIEIPYAYYYFRHRVS